MRGDALSQYHRRSLVAQASDCCYHFLMAPPQDLICPSLQAGLTCSYGCTPQRIMCHAFFDDECSVRYARYCDNGWHERAEYDMSLRYGAKQSSTEERNNRRSPLRLRSVVPSRKPTKRSRSEEPEEGTGYDTDTETQTTISLCQLGFYEGTPEPRELEAAYKKKMQEIQQGPANKHGQVNAGKRREKEVRHFAPSSSRCARIGKMLPQCSQFLSIFYSFFQKLAPFRLHR